MSSGGPLFKPFRALGYITEDVPFAVQRRGKATYVTVSVGRTWQVYDTAKLTLVMVGPQLPRQVSCLAVKGDLTFAACGPNIEECKRMTRTGTYAAGHTGGVVALLVLGDLLLTLGAEGCLKVWSIGSYDTPQGVCHTGPAFRPTCLLHPDTYLNKVLLGGGSGELQLWNIATRHKLHTFKGWGSPVRCLSGSPALDVIGVGLADGRAVVHNIKFDETLMEFYNVAGAGTAAEGLLGGAAAAAARGQGSSQGGACIALAFKSGPGIPLLAAGGGAGAITLWDLEQRRLHAIIKGAHDAPLLSLHFFAGEPLLMSSAKDNSIKHWVLDGQEAAPRLLRFRSGHSAPPTVVAHYGAGGLRLLSAGADRAFRCFSTIQDQQSRELSQKNVKSRAKRLKLAESELRLPPIVQLAACQVRERDWANVITCHQGSPAAYTWRLQNFTLGEHVLRPPPGDALPSAAAGQDAAVTAVGMSPCGNFGLVGTAAGRVDRYNMQSGLHRGLFCRRSTSSSSSSEAGPVLLPAHDGPVAGLAVDSTNTRLVSGGAGDGFLRIWGFKRQQLLSELDMGAPVTHLVLHAWSGLAAVAKADLEVVLVDVEAGRVVRRFKGHKDRITCVRISSDCRWLLTSSMDSTVRVWDIPAGLCLQAMSLGSPVTSLSLSDTGDLLATTHVHKRGVFLWSNQHLFGDPSQLALFQEGVVVPVGLPQIAALGEGAGRQEEVRLLADGGLFAAGDGDSSDEDEEPSSSSSDGSDEEEAAQQGKHAAAAAGGRRQRTRRGQPGTAAGTDSESEGSEEDSEEDEVLAFEAKDATGAPVPLAPGLATLSNLPKAQWQTLLHLDTIKARSRPLQPPKKPEAAPFFLPTVPSLARQPVFDTTAAAAAAGGKGQGGGSNSKAAANGRMNGTAAAADEDEEGSSDVDIVVDSEDEGQEGGAAGSSRVLRTKPLAADAPQATPFLHLLRAGGVDKDWASFIAHLRGLTPAALDLELRSLVLLEGATEQEVQDVALLLEALDAEVVGQRNWDFCQALIKHVLEVHADALMTYPALTAAATRLRRHLKAGWQRLDDLLEGVRAMTDWLNNTQLA